MEKIYIYILLVKYNIIYSIYMFCIMRYLMFMELNLYLKCSHIYIYIYIQWKRQPLFSQGLLGWSMGANVCPKYEGVFRDHPEYSHSNSSNGVWNIPLMPSSLRCLSFPYVSLHPGRTCLDGPSRLSLSYVCSCRHKYAAKVRG